MSTCRFSPEPLDDPVLFFGRELLVEELRDLMVAGPSPDFVFVHGAPKIGLTSLLRYLHRINLGLPRDRMRTCLVDLRPWGLLTEPQAMAHLAAALQEAVGGPTLGHGEISGLDLFRALGELRDRAGGRLVLLIDRGAELLRPAVQRVATTLLGMLNDSLPNLGMVLTFTPAAAWPADGGSAEDAVREISPLWTRAKTRYLGGLSTSGARRFVEAAVGAQTDDPALAAADREWALEMAGDHPLLLNRIGLSACRRLGQGSTPALRPQDRHALEEELCQELTPMVRAIVGRLEADRRGAGALALARRLAGSGHRRSLQPGSADISAVAVLAVEGLVAVEGPHGEPITRPVGETGGELTCGMPSAVLRELLLRTSGAGVSQAPRRARDATRRPARRHAIVRDDGLLRGSVALGDIEERILRRLLSSPNDVVRTQELVEAVWGLASAAAGEVAQRQAEDRLKQRLTRLRRKLDPLLGGDAIVNSYGRGYRLLSPERLRLDA